MKFLRQIICFAFASITLFSSSYLMVGLHVCSGAVQHVTLFSKAEACAMEIKTPPCHHESKPCCESETLIHEGQTYPASIIKADVPVASFVYVVQPLVFISEIIPSADQALLMYADYDPPQPTPDLTLSLHTFLI
ncbi:MAG: hypothetical protein JST69_08245 [Bacteroidetes bacterium]|nr:hypothetical protein [Bacteroidota bacterium]